MAFSSMVKELNRKSIIQLISDFKNYTKQDIAKATELSFPTVSKIVDEFLEDGMVHILPDKRGETGGRKAFAYILNKQYAYSLCLQVEKDSIQFWISDLQAEVSSTEKIYLANITCENIMLQIEKKLKEYKEIKSIVVGVPGAVHNGKIYMADGLETLNGCDLQKMIYDHFSLPTIVSNNMNLIIFGMKSDNQNIACIHIGEKGPGSSYLLNGHLLSGFCGFHGEVGFNPYNEKETFRDIALNGYKNVNMTEYIGRIVLQIITVINPEVIYLYPFISSNGSEIEQYCLKYVSKQVMPQIVLQNSYADDYQRGLLAMGLEVLLTTI